MYKINNLRGMKWHALNPELDTMEARKSNLILEAHIFLSMNQTDSTDDMFAEAAGIEEKLSVVCRAEGLLEKARMHLFSAASCWASAGDFYHAVALAETLLAEPDVPERLRKTVQEFITTIRNRRTAFVQELQLAAVASLKG
jgi:hypothetical protein